jgi:hypothetical protein
MTPKMHERYDLRKEIKQRGKSRHRGKGQSTQSARSIGSRVRDSLGSNYSVDKKEEGLQLVGCNPFEFVVPRGGFETLEPFDSAAIY